LRSFLFRSLAVSPLSESFTPASCCSFLSFLSSAFETPRLRTHPLLCAPAFYPVGIAYAAHFLFLAAFGVAGSRWSFLLSPLRALIPCIFSIACPNLCCNSWRVRRLSPPVSCLLFDWLGTFGHRRDRFQGAPYTSVFAPLRSCEGSPALSVPSVVLIPYRPSCVAPCQFLPKEVRAYFYSRLSPSVLFFRFLSLIFLDWLIL